MKNIVNLDTTIATVSAAIATLGTAFGIYHKTRADNRAAEMAEFRAINESYKELYTTVKAELEALRRQIDALTSEVERYKAEVVKFEIQDQRCQTELSILRAEHERILKHLDID